MTYMTYNMTYVVGEGEVDLFLQLGHDMWVCCQAVGQEGQRAAGGFIASKDQDHGLREDLMIS